MMLARAGFSAIKALGGGGLLSIPTLYDAVEVLRGGNILQEGGEMAFDHFASTTLNDRQRIAVFTTKGFGQLIHGLFTGNLNEAFADASMDFSRAFLGTKAARLKLNESQAIQSARTSRFETLLNKSPRYNEAQRQTLLSAYKRRELIKSTGSFTGTDYTQGATEILGGLKSGVRSLHGIWQAA